LWYRDLFTGRWGEFWLEEYFSDEYREYTEEEVAFLRG
jgi:protein-S-isoprenylcysteine O-methyltransferase Ste14